MSSLSDSSSPELSPSLFFPILLSEDLLKNNKRESSKMSPGQGVRQKRPARLGGSRQQRWPQTLEVVWEPLCEQRTFSRLQSSGRWGNCPLLPCSSVGKPTQWCTRSASGLNKSSEPLTISGPLLAAWKSCLAKGKSLIPPIALWF